MMTFVIWYVSVLQVICHAILLETPEASGNFSFNDLAWRESCFLVSFIAVKLPHFKPLSDNHTTISWKMAMKYSWKPLPKYSTDAAHLMHIWSTSWEHCSITAPQFYAAALQHCSTAVCMPSMLKCILWSTTAAPLEHYYSISII
jgi:hypothetical protein